MTTPQAPECVKMHSVKGKIFFEGGGTGIDQRAIGLRVICEMRNCERVICETGCETRCDWLVEIRAFND